MSDDQAVQPGDGHQQSDTAAIDALRQTLEKQTEELRASLEAERKAHKEAERRMHEATREAADLRRRTQKFEFTEQDAEKWRDDPTAFAKAISDSIRQQLLEDLDSNNREIAEVILGERERLEKLGSRVESGFRSLDPRTQSDDYKRLRETLGDAVSDEQIFQIMKIDNSQAPPPPAGGVVPRSAPQKTEESKAHLSFFGDALNRLERDGRKK